MIWDEYFYYDADSPTGIRWKINVYAGKDYKNIRISAGDKVGSFKMKDGLPESVIVKIKKKNYLVHRIVYEMLIGEIPEGYVVDHIDGNPWNNKIENLRITKTKINNRNRRLQRNNTSGTNGVTWVRTNNGGTAARGFIKIDGKLLSKTYVVSKYGLLPAFAMALMWRNKRIENLNLLGFGYTDSHGKSRI